MRVLFAGTPVTALPTCRRLESAGHEVVAVLTRPDAARGRSRRLIPSPVAAWAAERGIPVLKPTRPRGEEFIAELTGLAPDVCVVVAYGALLPADVLTIPRYGWINLHFSLLPRWRGAAPVQRTLIAGDRIAGVTTFRIVPALDAGPVYRSWEHPLRGDETTGSLLELLAEEGAEVMVQTLADLPRLTPAPQPETGVTIAPKLDPAEARLDWNRDGAELERLIRGCSPDPMAWTTLEGERLRIALARPLDTSMLEPGHLRVERRRVVVGTGTLDLELLRVQPQGRKEMAGADWGRGLRVTEARFDPKES